MENGGPHREISCHSTNRQLACPCPNTCPTFSRSSFSLSLSIYISFNYFQFSFPTRGLLSVSHLSNPPLRLPSLAGTLTIPYLNQWPPSPKLLSWLSLPSSSPSLPLPLRRLRLPALPPLLPPLLRRSSPLASPPSSLSPSDLLSGSEVPASRYGD